MAETRPARAAVLMWDWKEQPDVDELGVAIKELSEGDTVYLHRVNTQSDEYAVVLATVQLDKDAAFAVYDRRWKSEDAYDTSVFELETEVPRG